MKASRVRTRLKNAVHLFLQHSPEATITATKIVKSCQKELQWNTLGAQALGSIVVSLTDSVYYSSDRFLQEALTLLNGESVLPIRVYFNFDSYNEHMDTDDKNFYELLSSLTNKMTTLYHTNNYRLIDTVKDQQAQARNATQMMSISPLLEDAVTHRFILLHIASTVLSIDVGKFPTLHRYPPHPPYTPYYEDPAKPDLLRDIAWATHALQALKGQDWLTLSYYIRKDYFGIFVH
jgi:hypothetical protein